MTAKLFSARPLRLRRWNHRLILLVREACVMNPEYDSPPGQPSPPLTERAAPPIGWILSLLLVLGIVGVVAVYFGWR